jgi:phosphatidylinositol phospholipase C delta
MSAEFVKAAMQPIDDHPTLPDDWLRKGDVSIITMDTISMVPEVLQKGVMMTKILAKQQKRLIVRLDPDEGRILYKSTKHGIGELLILFCICFFIYFYNK